MFKGMGFAGSFFTVAGPNGTQVPVSRINISPGTCNVCTQTAEIDVYLPGDEIFRRAEDTNGLNNLEYMQLSRG